MKVRKQEVLNWFKQTMGAPELDLVDETYDSYARHVCMGGTKIFLLPKQVYVLKTDEGDIPIEYYQCMQCGKLIVNRNFM